VVKLPAPAKINLHLAVTGKTANGYHTLDTSFAYVDVSDTLFIEHAKGLHVTCSDPGLNTRDNLVFHVLEGMRSAFNVTQGLKVHIKKILPVRAGLGGGSSDAATAVGEQLEPLVSNIAGTHLVLAHPGTGLSTADVFSCYDSMQLHHTVQLTRSGAKDTIRAGSTKVENMHFPLGDNVLEDVACGMCPKLAALLEYMRHQVKCAWMSGSGTACVALAENVEDTHRLVRNLRQEKLAAWTHAGTVLIRHPLYGTGQNRMIGA